MSLMFRILIALLIVIQSSAATVTVSVGGSGNSFSPVMFTINPGDTVKWVWSSGFHNTSSVTLPTGAAPWTNNITSTDTTYSYVPTISGLYSYTCTYHSGMDGQFFVTGCTYPDKPIITSAASAIACQGDTVQLSAPLQTGVSYQWISGVTTIPLAVNNTLDVTFSGNYKVLANRCGMDSISDPFEVTVNPKPVAGYTYSNAGLSFTFVNTNTLPGPFTFAWTFDDGSLNQTTRDVYHTFPSAGNYFVTLKVTDTITGCSDTFSSTIEAEPVGITDPDLEFFSIFPNPATNVLNVTASEKVNVVIMSVDGKKLIEQKGASSIDVSSLVSGMYLIQVYGENNNLLKAEKFVKK